MCRAAEPPRLPSGAGLPNRLSSPHHRPQTPVRSMIMIVAVGTFYYGKERVTTTNVSVVEDGVRIYKKKVVTKKRPRSEWIGVPVPDSGIPPDLVTRAREALKGNVKTVSR